MEPVLLVQTRVPAGDGGESKQGQGRVGGGERVRGNMEGKMPIRIHTAGRFTSFHFQMSFL